MDQNRSGAAEDRLLLTDDDPLSTRKLTQLKKVIALNDQTGNLEAAWNVAAQ